MFRLCALVITALSLSSCTDKLVYVGQAINSDTQSETVTISGASYHMVNHVTGPPEDGAAPRLVYFVGGSGCASLTVYLAPYFSGAPSGLSIHALEKSGVRPGGLGRTCSDSFWKEYTFDTLLKRNVAALERLMKAHPGQEVAIVGASEGGHIAFELAARTEGVSRVAIIAAGGLPQREELRLLFERRNILIHYDSAMSAIASTPDSVSDRALGMPHRYWTAVLDRAVAPVLNQIKVPVLIIIGAEDDQVPVESARYGASILRNATLIEWPGASHTFDTEQGNVRHLVIKRVGQFLLQ